jgi:hypothetical protein
VGSSGSRTATASAAAPNVGQLVALIPIGTAPPEDTQAPTIPQNLQATAVSSTQVDLRWDPSSDNVDVHHYAIYRNDVEVGTSTLARFSDVTAQPDTSYTYRVKAIDAAGNTSDLSAGANATTPSASTGITFQGASSASTRGTSLSIPRPGGAAAGDVLVASIDVIGTPSIMAPTGWMLIGSNTSSSLTKATFRHLVSQSDPAAYMWSVPSDTTIAGIVVAYRGVDPVNPIDATGGQANGNNSSITAPSISTTTPNTMLVGFFGIASNTSITPPTGTTERGEITYSSRSGKLTIEVADQPFEGSGPTGARIAQASKAAVSIGRLVALRAA